MVKLLGSQNLHMDLQLHRGLAPLTPHYSRVAVLVTFEYVWLVCKFMFRSAMILTVCMLEIFHNKMLEKRGQEMEG